MENPNDQRNDINYTGVRKRKWGKWVSEIRMPNSRERIWLGSYDSAEKAARAFDAALFCLRGPSAKFNFPDNPPDIPGGTSLQPSEIRVAAARYAHSQSGTSCPDQYSSPSSSLSSSPSYSVSGGPTRSGTETAPNNGQGLDLFAGTGLENDGPGSYDMFPGFDDFSDEFFGPPLTSAVDYGEENGDGAFSQDPFLWNFS